MLLEELPLFKNELTDVGGIESAEALVTETFFVQL
jgi:hypothetical protein